MKSDNNRKARADRVWLTRDDCDIDDFAALVSKKAAKADYPHAYDIVKNVPVYNSDTVLSAASDPASRRELMAEWVEVLSDGPGVLVLAGAFADQAPVDAVTAEFQAMIDEQRKAGTTSGDHFAKPGANDRVWNAIEKLCLRAPKAFAAYYANPAIAMVCEAWLGPGYQVTSQVNCVNPGGAAQSAHRDYHLGFQSADVIERYPAHVHRLSPVLTLQGAVAHCDMPLESGPTLYLPFSQRYEPGYLATGMAEFRAYFAEHHVQLPLKKGDAAFFNPALFHGAGDNRSSDIKRMANLLQVSSAYGRAMESVDRTRMSAALFPALKSMLAEGAIDEPAACNAIAACAEGYSFPTNLDRDPPVGGLAPQTQQSLFQQALEEEWENGRFLKALEEQAAKKLT